MGLICAPGLTVTVAVLVAIVSLVVAFFSYLFEERQKAPLDVRPKKQKEILIYGECPHRLPQEAVLYLAERKGYEVLENGSDCENPQSALVVAGKLKEKDKDNPDPRGESIMIDQGAKKICYKDFYAKIGIHSKAEAKAFVNRFDLRKVQISDLSTYPRTLPVQVAFADYRNSNRTRKKVKQEAQRKKSQLQVVADINKNNAYNTFAVIHDDMFKDIASCNLTAQAARFRVGGARVMSYDDFFKIP